MPVTKTLFNLDPKATTYTITNGQLEVKILDYGATIVSILFPDKRGIKRDVVLGFDDFGGYSSKFAVNPYVGCTVGRTANRIGNSTFALNGKQYKLYANNGPNSLHGGKEGFNRRFWSLVAEDSLSITLQYVSPDGEEGYPGVLRTLVKFSVTESNELRTEYSAYLDANQTDCGSDLQTVVNLTNHSYFNLNGAYSGDTSQVLDHEILMQAKSYLEMDNWLLPTGKILPVSGTHLDFTGKPRTIGERAFQMERTNQNPHGYDLCYVLDENPANYQIDPEEIHKALEVFAPQTGIKMTLLTTEPSFQFYTGQSFPESKPKRSQTGDSQVKLGSYAGFCIEAQRFVDAPNQRDWLKQVVLSGEQKYKQITVYRFEQSGGFSKA